MSEVMSEHRCISLSPSLREVKESLCGVTASSVVLRQDVCTNIGTGLCEPW